MARHVVLAAFLMFLALEGEIGVVAQVFEEDKYAHGYIDAELEGVWDGIQKFNNDKHRKGVAISVFIVIFLVVVFPRIYGYAAASKFSECAVEDPPPGFTVMNRIYDVASEPDFQPEIRDADAMLVFRRSSNGRDVTSLTPYSQYTRDRPGQIGFFVIDADLPGLHNVDEGDILIAVNCETFSDDTPSGRGRISHLMDYVEKAGNLGEKDIHKAKPVTFTLLHPDDESKYCREKRVDEDTNGDSYDDDLELRERTECPSDFTDEDEHGSGFNEWIHEVLEAKEFQTRVKDGRSVPQKGTKEQRHSFKVVDIRSGKHKKLTSPANLVRFLLCTALSFAPLVMLTHTDLVDNPPGSSQAGDTQEQAFIQILLAVGLLLIGIPLYYMIIKKGGKIFQQPVLKNSFIMFITILCTWLPLRVMMIAYTVKTPENIKAVHIAANFLHWVDNILGTLYFINAFALYLRDQYDWRLPQVLSNQGAMVILGLSEVIASTVDWLISVRDSTGSGEGCRMSHLLNPIHDMKLEMEARGFLGAVFNVTCSEWPEEAMDMDFETLWASSQPPKPFYTDFFPGDHCVCELTCTFNGMRNSVISKCVPGGLDGGIWSTRQFPYLVNRMCHPYKFELKTYDNKSGIDKSGIDDNGKSVPTSANQNLLSAAPQIFFCSVPSSGNGYDASGVSGGRLESGPGWLAPTGVTCDTAGGYAGEVRYGPCTSPGGAIQLSGCTKVGAPVGRIDSASLKAGL